MSTDSAWPDTAHNTVPRPRRVVTLQNKLSLWEVNESDYFFFSPGLGHVVLIYPFIVIPAGWMAAYFPREPAPVCPTEATLYEGTCAASELAFYVVWAWRMGHSPTEKLFHARSELVLVGLKTIAHASSQKGGRLCLLHVYGQATSESYKISFVESAGPHD